MTRSERLMALFPRRIMCLVPWLAAAVLLASCGDESAGSNTNGAVASAPSAAAEPTGSVVRDTSQPLPAPAPTPVAIQSQPGPEGTRVDLTRAAVTGDILTVQLAYTAPADRSFSDYFNAGEVSVIDDATAQRYGILKDQTGAWLAAPMFTTRNIRPAAKQGQIAIVWMKFPAPPASSRTVSINIPKVGPFDGVPVTRQ